MPTFMGAESGNFDIVPQQIRILGNWIVLAAEKLLLIIEAWPPGEIRTDFQIFAQAMADHVDSVHAFGWLHVMRAACRVNVMIAGPPAELGRIDPAFDFESAGLWLRA